MRRPHGHRRQTRVCRCPINGAQPLRAPCSGGARRPTRHVGGRGGRRCRGGGRRRVSLRRAPPLPRRRAGAATRAAGRAARRMHSVARPVCRVHGRGRREQGEVYRRVTNAPSMVSDDTNSRRQSQPGSAPLSSTLFSPSNRTVFELTPPGGQAQIRSCWLPPPRSVIPLNRRTCRVGQDRTHHLRTHLVSSSRVEREEYSVRN